MAFTILIIDIDEHANSKGLNMGLVCSVVITYHYHLRVKVFQKSGNELFHIVVLTVIEMICST